MRRIKVEQRIPVETVNLYGDYKDFDEMVKINMFKEFAIELDRHKEFKISKSPNSICGADFMEYKVDLVVTSMEETKYIYETLAEVLPNVSKKEQDKLIEVLYYFDNSLRR